MIGDAPGPLLAATLQICSAGLAAAFVLAFVRVVRGPTLPDRVLGLDLLSSVLVAVVAIVSIEASLPVLLGIALAIGLVAFLATVAFAWYVERSGAS